ncbi:hypothetical protein HMPREF1248_0198 [Coriobacteriaceae bacterium BV3Ac1]|nr:hypothetical protein HMPREF1248_0198 [Coriobacteriaceae bacterium BV3Ac1]
MLDTIALELISPLLLEVGFCMRRAFITWECDAFLATD